VGIVAVRLKKKQATSDKYSFGYKRAEVAGALCNSVFLLALCFVIIVEAIQRFIEPENMKDAKLVFIVGTAGLVINLVGLAMFWEEGGHGHSHGGGGHSHDNKGHEDDEENHSHSHYDETNVDTEHQENTSVKPEKSSYNMNIRGVWLHVLGDALGSVVVMIAAGLIWYIETNALIPDYISSDDIFSSENGTLFKLNSICNENPINVSSCYKPSIEDFKEFINSYKTSKMFPVRNFFWFAYNYADPLLSVIITIIILFSTIPLAKDSLKIILQARPDNFSLNLKQLQKDIGDKVGAQINLHHLHAWELSSDTVIASLHMGLPADIEVYRSAVNILRGKLCAKYKLHHLTIEPEFQVQNTQGGCEGNSCCGDMEKNGPPCGLGKC